MRVEGVEGLEGGVGGYGYGAVAAGEEEVGWWGDVRERRLVGLQGWWVRGLGGWGWLGGYGDEGVVLWRFWFLLDFDGEEGHRMRWDRMVMCNYLPPDHDNAPVRRPGDRQPFPSQLHSRRARLAPHVPESARAVAAHGRQFGLFRRVPGHALDAPRVPAQLGAVLHLRLLRVPDPQRAVRGARCDQVARGIPGYGADSGGGALSGCCVFDREGFLVKKRAVEEMCVRVGAWTAGGGVVVGLDFEG